MKKNPIRVPGLNPGDSIGLVSPAGVVKPEQVETGLKYLEENGFFYQLGKHVFSNNNLTSAPVQHRIADLVNFLKDPNIKVIWSLRGGYGSIQLLNKLDYRLFQKYPKLIIGFSDITVLHWGIFQKTGLPALSGLTLTMQVSKENPFMLTGFEILSGRCTGLFEEDLTPEKVFIAREGSVNGTLVGGTLSMICTLCGTPYWLEKEGLILYLEDVNEPLYRVDRYFRQLSLMNFWERVNGIILGKFLYQEENVDVLPLLLPLLPSSIPVVYNFPYGHLMQCCPLPVGVAAELQTSPFELCWKPFIV
jgi:muramoyltetrapeptide carboxypeptidase